MDLKTKMKATEFFGVHKDNGRLYTKNLVPGVRVYGEKLVSWGGEEYREWMYSRSKLAAYLKLGGSFFPFNEDTQVLYLGAASGTTASHLSDILVSGTLYCVEISPRPFRDLVMVSDMRSNIVPLLADATQPSSFDFAVGNVDVVYQDVAQRGQTSILIKNMEHFGARIGMLTLKSRSEDVSRRPAEIFKEARTELLRVGLKMRDMLPLDPFEKDHAMMVVERG
jgi:fibrillarin-like pre-rRNA processing protein